MKTAISVPEETFLRVELLAKQHGMNRSQFYAIAADRYADELESGEVTAAIDAAVDAVNADASSAFAVSATQRAFDRVDDEW